MGQFAIVGPILLFSLCLFSALAFASKFNDPTGEKLFLAMKLYYTYVRLLIG
jgi:hypothetical protein